MTKIALAALLALAVAACASEPDPTVFEGTWRLSYSGRPCFLDDRIDTIVVGEVPLAGGDLGVETPYFGYAVTVWNGVRPMSSRTATSLDGYTIDLVNLDGESLSIRLFLIDPPAATVRWTGAGADQQPCQIEMLTAVVTKTSD